MASVPNLLSLFIIKVGQFCQMLFLHQLRQACGFSFILWILHIALINLCTPGINPSWS